MIEQLRNDLQMAAASLAPSVELYGLAKPDNLQVDPDEYVQMLDTRVQVEQAITRLKRQDNKGIGGWTFADGLYYRYGDDLDEDISKVQHPLFPEEVAVARAIDRSLEGQEDVPVMALDFGGGMGLSWMRIAARPKYRKAIESSRLAMVVTNLGSVPEKSIDAEGYSGISRSMRDINKSYPEYTTADLCWAQENQGYVQYLDANSLELPEMAIDLPDGNNLPLKGNVGIIHERLALAHTHVPDLAVAVFGKLLNRYGVLRSDVATHYHLMHPESFSEITVNGGEVISVTEEYSYQRRLGLIIGSMMLRQSDYSYELEEQNDVGVFSRLSGLIEEVD